MSPYDIHVGEIYRGSDPDMAKFVVLKEEDFDPNNILISKHNVAGAPQNWTTKSEFSSWALCNIKDDGAIDLL